VSEYVAGITQQIPMKPRENEWKWWLTMDWVKNSCLQFVAMSANIA
jgi:hypothetical protein